MSKYVPLLLVFSLISLSIIPAINLGTPLIEVHPEGYEDLNPQQKQSLRDLETRYESNGNNENNSNIVFERITATNNDASDFGTHAIALD